MNTTDSKAATELGFELGCTYHNDYWNATHTIIDSFFSNGWACVTSKWADGHVTIHSTELGKKDTKVSN